VEASLTILAAVWLASSLYTVSLSIATVRRGSPTDFCFETSNFSISAVCPSGDTPTILYTPTSPSGTTRPPTFIAFAMPTVSHRPAPISSPVDFKLRHYRLSSTVSSVWVRNWMKWTSRKHRWKCLIIMVAPGRVELPTFGLGNRCSIHLSYGAGANSPIISRRFIAINIATSRVQGFGSRSSTARLSSNTLTRGSPSSPNSRW
jgi:hypothetical protein